MSSIGLPGTNGFVGEFLILSGTFLSNLHGAPFYSGFAALGVILGAAYMLTMVQRVWLGPMRNPRNEGLQDLNVREAFAVVPLILVAIGMGVYPQPFLDQINPAAVAFTERLRQLPELPSGRATGQVQPGQRSPMGSHGIVVDPSRLNQIHPVGK